MSDRRPPPKTIEEFERAMLDARLGRTEKKDNPLDRFVEALRDAFPDLADQTRRDPGEVAATAAQAVVDLQGSMTGSTKEEMAEAISDRLSPDEGGKPLSLPVVLKEMSEKIERMGQILGGVSRQFGVGSEVVMRDAPDREVGKVTVKNFPPDPFRDSETADAVSVPPNTWTTVVSKTLTVPAIVTGYGTDPTSVTALGIQYRERLRVGGAGKQIEAVGSNAVSWVPIEVSVSANTAFDVQVLHGEVTAQNFSGSLAWRES